MSELKDKALAGFPPSDRPNLILDHHDARHFGNGMVEYVFHGLLVRITNDRSDIYGDVGHVGFGLVSVERLVAKTHPSALGVPDARSAAGISEYVRTNVTKILEILPKRDDAGDLSL